MMSAIGLPRPGLRFLSMAPALGLQSLGLQSLGWQSLAGVSLGGMGAIVLVGLILRHRQLLRALSQAQQVETSLRQAHAQLEVDAQAQSAQLTATNERLQEEVQRTHTANLVLARTESRLNMALDATQTIIWDFNLQTGEVTRSGDTQALFGLTHTTLDTTQAAFLDRVHPDDRHRTEQDTLEAIAHQVPLSQEYRVVWDDGSTHWLAARGKVRHDPLDGSDHLVGFTIDITQQKWLEEELRLTQELSQAIVEATGLLSGLAAILQRMTTAIAWDFAEAWLPKPGLPQPGLDKPAAALTLQCTCRGDDRRLQDFVKASQALVLPMHMALPGRIWASQQSEWLLDLSQVTPEQFIRGELARAAGLQTTFGVPIVVEGQTIAIFLFFSFTLRPQDDRVTHLLKSLTDRLSATIQRKRAEEQLQESYALLQTVFSSTPDPIFVKDFQGRYRFVNEATIEVLGRPTAEILGQDDTAFFAPDIAEALRQVDRRIMTTGITEVVEEQVPYQGEMHYFLTTKGAWRNAQGEAIGLVGLGRDITDRVQDREAIRQLNQNLEQRVRDRTAQLEAANRELETFSYSVSHDLRAPLRSIDGFSQILLTRYHANLDAGGQHYLQRIRANVHRMGELIDDLLQLSRVTLGQMISSPVNLSAIAQETASQLSATQPDREVAWTIAPAASTQGDPRLLKIVLENLLGNAWKYTAQRSAAQIEFGVYQSSVRNSAQNPPGTAAQSSPLDSVALPPGANVYFVRDNGAGFNMAYASKLFIAFQRLHSETEFPGTGVGLATVARIIQRHGGQVGAIAAVDQGATFYFTLPA
jgi:PAS domain S-box-containing protein